VNRGAPEERQRAGCDTRKLEPMQTHTTQTSKDDRQVPPAAGAVVSTGPNLVLLLRDANPDDVVQLHPEGGVRIRGMPVWGREGRLLEVLLRSGERLTVRLLREVCLSGLLSRIRWTGNGRDGYGLEVVDAQGKPLHGANLEALARASLRERYLAAKERGMCLVVRNPARVKAVTDQGESVLVEKLCEGLVEVGGYYPYFVVERNLAKKDAMGAVVEPTTKFAVLLSAMEDVRDEASARRAFGRPLHPAFVEQAAARARAHAESAALARLKTGDAVHLGVAAPQ
jgi:hypothetical protein